jgi:hypothetical protein
LQQARRSDIQETTMRSALTMAVLLAALGSGCATWEGMNSSERGLAVGATGGAVVGGIVGGPVGAAIGAGVGGYAGHHEGLD